MSYSVTRLILTAFAAIAITACARSVEPASLAAMSKASAEINKQAQIAFADSNRLAREVSVDRFIRSRQPGLTEQQFITAVDRNSMLAWQTALGDLESYASLLASLVDTKRGVATSDALVAFGQQLRDGRTDLAISPGIAAAFASLGGALVNARAQSRAREILAQTDPHVQSLLHQMAAAIGESDREELRGTVWSNWTDSFRETRESYGAAAEAGNEARQRSLIAEYLAGLDRRDAQLSALANLRSSLLTLAAAHGTAAAGDTASLAGLLESVETRLNETKRLFEAFQRPANP